MCDSLRSKRMRSETQISKRLRNDCKRVAINVYQKNSFDRFGDDLTEELLQYLTFEDKIKLESVSKQWQRCVYQRQTVLEILDPESEDSNELHIDLEYNRNERQNSLDRLLKDERRQLNVKAFESVLKKCQNIKKVILGIKVSTNVLSLIGQYCHHIRSLKYERIFPLLRSNKCLDFYRMYGHKLEELSFAETDEPFNEYLEYCPNLKTISFNDNYLRFKEDKEFLPKLQRIDTCLKMWHNYHPLSYYHGEFKNLQQLKILANKYSKTMKSLIISFCWLTREELKTCIEYIVRFENLKQLHITIGFLEVEEPIDDCLIPIGQKCTKLLKLDLSISPLVHISGRFFDLFSELKDIKKIKFRFPNKLEDKGSVEAFRHCLQLKELYIHYENLTEDFFTDVQSFVPNLQSLRVCSEEDFSDSFIDSSDSMRNIQKISLCIKTSDSFFVEQNFPEMVRHWYFGKSMSEVMSSPMAKDVIRKHHNYCLVIKNK